MTTHNIIAREKSGVPGVGTITTSPALKTIPAIFGRVAILN